MQFKKYIATFLVLIFLGKMISIDAKYLGVIFDSSEVTLVNKLCPKKQLQQDSTGQYKSDNFDSGFELNYLCHVAFDVQISDSPEAPVESNFRQYSYHAPGKFYAPGDKFYPPPRA